MTVPPELFTSRMSHHWHYTLGNEVGDVLKAVWKQMAITFNRQITSFNTPEQGRWRILQPPTGTGKSQGLALYCSMLPREKHPGVLIVTRLKTQADEMAETINKLSGDDAVAKAYHSDNRFDLQPFDEPPVLIITHKAYELALDRLSQSDTDGTSVFDAFMLYGGERRRLVVIDEALDVVQDVRVDLTSLRLLQGVLPYEVKQAHPAEVELLADLINTLDALASDNRGGTGTSIERFLLDPVMAAPSAASMEGLREALKTLSLDQLLSRRNDKLENTRLRNHYDDLLVGVSTLINRWQWYSRIGSKDTINTARLIIPDQGYGAVVLDATATSNLVYQLFDARAEIVPIPSHARSYANVTLHVSTGHRVGKGYLRDNAKEEVSKLVGHLTAELGPERKVFVCCHKAVEPYVLHHQEKFGELGVGHWMAVDGKNDWQDFDTAVIFGLPYRDRVVAANTFMAFRGPQDDRWLNSEGDRPFGKHSDIRHALEVGHMVVSVTQAVNRVRCRRVIDSDGNCPPTDIYILLPEDKTGRAVLQGLMQEMPGIKIAKWKYASTKRRVRGSAHAEAVLCYVSSLSTGRYSATEIRDNLGIPRSSWKWLTAHLRDQSHKMHQQLVDVGARLQVEGSGRGARSYIVKA